MLASTTEAEHSMRGRAGKAGRNGEITIIRREEVVEGGSHGGAWKVAYADFVTAMMAFFLLMWLLNATTEDQRKGLADYFSPNNLLSHASSGTGQPFGGHTAFDKGGLVSDRGSVQIMAGKRPVVTDPEDDDPGLPQSGEAPTPSPPTATPSVMAGATPVSAASKESAEPSNPNAAVVAHTPTEAELAAEQAKREKQQFEQAAEQLKQAVKDDPALAELSRQLAIDLTPEGLRIQMLDEERSAMFATGSSTLNERAQLLLSKVAPVLMRLSQDIAVVGHTDATPFAGNGRTNWELSTERANATRRLLVDAGLAATRVSRVTGLADRDPLLPADPFAAANRRIAIIVLYGTKRPADGSVPPAEPAKAPAVVPASVTP
jgi:chemotaxis protein MotB